MGRRKLPDHLGRMPDHPRYGNTSDPAEESERIHKAYENVDNWGRRYGSDFYGGVKMSYGASPTYEVPIGNPEIAQKIVSRPIASQPEKALIESAEAAPEPPPLQAIPPRQFWLWRLLNRINGAFR